MTSKPTFVPADDRIAVKIPKPEEKIGNLFIPERAQRQSPSEGVVFAVANYLEEFDIPATYPVGTKIFFTPGSGYSLTIDGEDILVLKYEDILGKIE